MLSVLFLCTGNSCRSIVAEALLAHHGYEHFNAYSAGSFPSGVVHPRTFEALKAKGMGVLGYRSKSWHEFIDKQIDIVITVCDAAASESCPHFPGNPIKLQWVGHWFNFVQFQQLRTVICCVLLLGHSYGYVLIAIHNI